MTVATSTAAKTRHGRRELMDRTALLIEPGKRPFRSVPARYTAPRAGVKVARRAAAVLVLALLAAPGFSRAQAPADTTKTAAPAKSVFIDRILFSGNEHVRAGELRARMRTREPSFFSVFKKPTLDEHQLARDVSALEAYYHSLGYPDASVRLDHVEYLENRRFADIHIRVVEGEPNLVRSVVFEGNLVLEEKKLREGLLLEPDSPYNPSLLETDVYTIRGKYFDEGYLAVTIADSVRIDDHRVDIRFYVQPRRQLQVGQISIEGNEEVRTGVIQAEITVKTGEICRYNKVLETERNLFETGLFSVADVVPEHVDTMTNVVDIRIRVRERKESWVEAGFGVGNVLGSRVFAEWGTRNLFGTGRTVRLKAQYAFDLFEGDEFDPDQFKVTNTYYRYDAIYQQRRVFGLKLPTGLNGYIEWDNTVPGLEVNTLGAAVGVSHEFGRIRDFGRESLVVGTFSVEDITRDEAEKPEERSRSNILGSSLSRDTRDFVLNPSIGDYRVVSAQVAGGILGGENDFYTVEAGYQNYLRLRRGRDVDDPRTRSVFAWRVRVGDAESYGRSDEVPVENRYFLGGANSVRGYEESGLGPHDGENATGGTFEVLVNLELRYPLPFLWRWNFSGSLFLDSGNVWADVKDVSSDDFEFRSGIYDTTEGDYRYGVGIGIRYNTPIGPIRLDWGFPTKPDVLSEGGMLYLSLGQIF
jgi:outer membrane protein insertion porin family